MDNPVNFRSELAKHQGLISGSFALQFFEGVVWPKSDLDIFIERTYIHDRSVEEMCEYLVREEDYVREKSQFHDQYSWMEDDLAPIGFDVSLFCGCLRG